MCGIAGDRTGSGERVQRMLDLLHHRGPDDSGAWCGLDWQIGMTRLAIIDPEHGRQPMQSADRRWVLVLNGEIYNFRALSQEVRRAGAVLQTRSDTEVLLELIAQRGVPQALELAEGMFALAAVDTMTGDLWLARDRFGEKPLFIDRRQTGFAFCSELSPLLATCAQVCSMDPASVTSIIRYGYPAPGTSAVQGVAELLPGHWLRRSQSGQEQLQRYWQFPDRVDEEAGPRKRCGERLLELLDASVRDRLMADVPLGLFLSGGIDSSAVAASAVVGRSDIEAICVGFDDKQNDERPLARLTARRLGIRLIEEHGAFAPYSESMFDDLLDHYGQPFMDTSAVPTRAVSRAARRYFKVVLSGDGGDELLGGYIYHRRAQRLSRYGGGRAGAWICQQLSAMVPERGRWESLQRAFLLNAHWPAGSLATAMDGVFSDSMVLELFAGTAWGTPARQCLESAQEEARRIWASVNDPILALSIHALHTTLPQDILMKVDRMSMAESLEVRSPFLDSKLATYALSLPAPMKLHAGKGKYVLREALGGRLPKEMLGAPKKGFTLPVRDWLGATFWRDLHHEVERYGADPDCEMNPAALRERVRRDREVCNRLNHFRALHRAVTLYAFLRWRRLLRGKPAGQMAAVGGARTR